MLTKKELKEAQIFMSKILAEIREPKHKKSKFPFPTKYPLLNASEIISYAADVIDILIDMKKDEPDTGELWLIKIDNVITVGEILAGNNLYLPGEEDARSFDEVQKFIRRVETKEE